jgi:hypothetical protein
MRFRVAASILALGTFNISAFDTPANAETGADLRQVCSANLADANYLTGRCVGYISAVVDEVSEKQVMTKQNLFCFPSNVTNRDIFDGVRAFLDENKDQKDVPAHILVEYALRVKFPCR